MAGALVAFKSFNFKSGILGSPWAGFSNFRFFFISGIVWDVTRNTIFYNLLFMVTCNIMQIAAAIFLAEMWGKLAKRFMQSVMFLPYFISWVVVGAFVYNIFNYEHGALNSLLRSMGLDPVNVYELPWIWKYILTFFNSWKWVGYGSIIYLSSIMGFDVESYAAATLDGANIFQKIRYITLPMLKPTVVTLTLISVGNILRGNFDMFYQIIGNNGQLFAATDVIDTFVFRSLTSSSDFGMASAAAFYQSALCFVIIMAVNAIVKKIDSDYALF
jgi:putative aldouronate transport system permease protein